MAWLDRPLGWLGRSVFYEQTWLEKLALEVPKQGRVDELAVVTAERTDFPILGFSIGPDDPDLPVFGLFGGVHGLERVGTHVVLSFLDSLFVRLGWDRDLRQTFKHVRLVAIPLVNPGGMYLNRRANPRGVDLMRNAPVDAETPPPLLVGGHRLSPHLPWYRGEEDWGLEIEAEALCRFVERETFAAPLTLTLDVHSGFGGVDRMWFPYAKSKALFPQVDLVERFKRLLDRSFPNHVYLIEQQADSYTAHGDLWDHLYERYRTERRAAERPARFIPWTLELGSWAWIRKNPRQLLSTQGAFNPMMPHRYERIMRRHLVLLDFYLRAARNHKTWAPKG